MPTLLHVLSLTSTLLLLLCMTMTSVVCVTAWMSLIWSLPCMLYGCCIAQCNTHYGLTNRASNRMKCVSGMLIYGSRHLTWHSSLAPNCHLELCVGIFQAEAVTDLVSCNGMNNRWRWQQPKPRIYHWEVHAMKASSCWLSMLCFSKPTWGCHPLCSQWVCCNLVCHKGASGVEGLLYGATAITYLWSAMQSVLQQGCQARGYTQEYCSPHRCKVKVLVAIHAGSKHLVTHKGKEGRWSWILKRHDGNHYCKARMVSSNNKYAHICC